MFGIFKKRMRTEQIKLVYQNHSALNYLAAFMEPKTSKNLESELKKILYNWGSDECMSTDDALRMLEINRMFRRLYDTTPGVSMKSFDDYFQPLLGWKEYIEDFNGDDS